MCNVHGQSLTPVNRKFIENKKRSFDSPTLNERNFFQIYQSDLGLSPADSHYQVNAYHDVKTNFTRKKYQQSYNGLDVIGGTYILHFKEGILKKSTGALYPYINLDVAAKVNSKEATTIARGAMDVKFIDQMRDNVAWKEQGTRLCVIDKSFPSFSGEMTLAYEHHFLNSILNINSSYSLNNYIFSEFVNDGEDYSGNALTGVPSSTFGGNVYWQGGKKYPFFASIQYQFVDEMPVFDDNSLFTESYNLVNTKFGYQYQLKKITLDLFMGVNNVFNEKYASMISVNPTSFGNRPPRLYYAGLPRNVYAGVRMMLEI